MKFVSKRISGVKNGVSSTTSLLRGEPFSQVKSPKAKGVWLSTAGAATAAGVPEAAEFDAEAFGATVLGATADCDCGGGSWALCTGTAWASCTFALEVRFCATATVIAGGLANPSLEAMIW